MAAIAGEFGGGFAPVALVERVSAMGEEQLGQVPAAGAGGGEQRGEAAGLDGVDRSTVPKKKLDRCGVPAQRQSSVEGLVALRILTDGVDRGPGSKQDCDLGCGSEGCGEVERGPAVAGKGVSEFRVRREERFKLRLVAGSCGFKDIKGDARRGQAGQQKVAHQGLAAVDGPDQSGNALRIAGGGKRGVGLNGIGDFCSGALLNEFQERGTHVFTIQDRTGGGQRAQGRLASVGSLKGTLVGPKRTLPKRTLPKRSIKEESLCGAFPELTQNGCKAAFDASDEVAMGQAV